jgi:alpha-galactosidase
MGSAKELDTFSSLSFRWQTNALILDITVDNESGVPCIENFQPRNAEIPESISPHFPSAAVPINGLKLSGQGHSTVKTAKSLVGSSLSSQTRYCSHKTRTIDGGQALDIISKDHVSGLEATQTFEAFDDVPVIRCWSILRNTGTDVLDLTQASSFSIGGLTKGVPEWWMNYSVWSATNTWFREAQWHEYSLPQIGIDQVGLLALNQGHSATMARYSISNQGAMSTEGHLAMGAVTRNDNSDSWLWQIEHNGSWRWEIGDWQDGLYVAASGPTMVDSAWSATLPPGGSFTTVPAALCHVNGTLEDAFGAMNNYRRRIVTPCVDHEERSIIFNDYMNCL